VGRISPYSLSEIDFLVAHIIPVQAIMCVKTVRLYPRNDPRGEYRRYREVWQLLKPS
jgi:hypothetical protein